MREQHKDNVVLRITNLTKHTLIIVLGLLTQMGTLATQMRSTMKYNCVANQYSVNKSPVQDASGLWPSWIFLQSQFNMVKKMIGNWVQS